MKSIAPFGCVMVLMKSNKPYIGMFFIVSVYAGMGLFTKAAISNGMNPYVFVFYRQAFATLALAPFSFFLERMEKISVNKWHGVAKVLGCLVPLVKQYPAKLRLIALQCFFSCIQAAIWAVAVDRSVSSWKLQWDLNLLSVLFCGVIVTGISYWVRIWVIQRKGPVFLAIFTPLQLPIAAAFSAIFWDETLHWGSVGGAVMLAGGLYSILWGKHREGKANAIKVLKSKESAKDETTHGVNDNVEV
ncbi:nodulin MtN21 /EamA-like transporter family protein [Actinidia rufa]|uniref:WAT1-related protein n=1 Tax=Actinidia rufa TaxID=165716 RepID=A0A7J0GGU3_9ERIC|nr:nodulin MtN21 /EamA-like transporter family protein [Actinidia rufa]